MVSSFFKPTPNKVYHCSTSEVDGHHTKIINIQNISDIGHFHVVHLPSLFFNFKTFKLKTAGNK